MVGRKKNLSTDERNLCVQFILQDSRDGRPKYGRLREAQERLGYSRSTVQRLWKQVNSQHQQGLAIHVQSRKINRKGTRNIIPDLDKLMSLPLSVRSTSRRLEIEMKVSKSTLSRWAKPGILKAHTSAIKPSLTADNKFLRMRFSLESLGLDRFMNKIMFSTMHNVVHIDEKWFFITKGSRRYYLAPEEEEPYRACKNKKFIGKIMFLCAVSRHMLRADGNVMFDGKICIFPFTHQVEALRKSKYREKGTLITTPTDSITREVMKACIVKEVVPAIRSRWPASASKEIFIQQDNARPRIMDKDPDFRAEASKEGFNIQLIQQPPNSPDCNINDLGFFRSIQSLQEQKMCKTMDDLVAAVVEAFYELEPSTLNKVFLTLQGCLTEIMKGKGHNKYKILHMGNDALIRQDALPVSLEIPMDLARECIQYLIENGQVRGIEQLISRLGIQSLTW